MWYLELGCCTYNLTGIVFCVLLVTFVLGITTCLNNQLLKYKKRWQQILVRLAFVEAIFATIFFAYPKVSSNLDNAMIFACFAVALFAIFFFFRYDFLARYLFCRIDKMGFCKSGILKNE